jgi:hypothetical protein
MTSLTNGHVYKDINQIKKEEGVASGSQQGQFNTTDVIKLLRWEG